MRILQRAGMGREIASRANAGHAMFFFALSHEAPLCCAGRQVGTAVCLDHAAVGDGSDVEIRSVGRHGECVSATCTQARRPRATHRDAIAMGGVHEALDRAVAVDGDALRREADGAG